MKLLGLYVVILLATNLECSTSNWDYFVFAHEWPESACIDANTTGHQCVIPGQVSTWIIHGLWPGNRKGKDPFFCNNSWPFDESNIKSIEPQLDQYWPNMYVDSSKTQFWAHEWSKHGTCCTDLDETRDEYHYFSSGLTLNKRYNVTQYLEKHSIVPGKSYQLSDIQKALGDEFGEDKFIVECNHEDHNTYLNTIELCLNRDLHPIECPKGQYSRFARGLAPDGLVKEMGRGGINAELCSTHKDVIYPNIRRSV